MTDPELYIPVDDTIKDFIGHLMAHPRTILSAKFGDGKTYFLQKFHDDKYVHDHFRILTLYPINYQVADNKDIFDLIKYDLLLQLIQNKMVSEEYEVRDDIIASFFLQHNNVDVLNMVLTGVNMVSPGIQEVSALIHALQCTKLFKSFFGKYNEYKVNNTPAGNAFAYVQKINNHFVYENDVITSIIRDVISIYKRNHVNERVVLVVEDMDRLDPAHLFRILNILSAHMDYTYRCIGEENAGWLNKFDVDNIVLVFDYNNTKKIFHHFYGEHTDFKGYISKFTTNGYFSYSLSEKRRDYINEQIREVINLPQKICEKLIPDTYFEGKTIREISEALRDINSQILTHPEYQSTSVKCYLPIQLLQVMVVLRRLGVLDEEIKTRFIDVLILNTTLMLPYLGGYVLHQRKDGFLIDVEIRDFNKYADGHTRANVYRIESLQDDGRAIFHKESISAYDEQSDKIILDTISAMLKYVGR